MFKKASILLGLALTLLVTGTVFAQDDGPTPEHSALLWDAIYWNNTTLSGIPQYRRDEANLDWNWGSGSPHHVVSADHFSARWTRIVDLSAGTYRFTATSDDGVRVYVDGRLLIDEWHDHPTRTYTADVYLNAGHHEIKMEYYENLGDAVARLSWASIPDVTEGWYGEYFSNRWLSGFPTLVREDAHVDFKWGYSAPASGIPSDGFSVRWTRTVHLEAGRYRFTTATDDGVRLWVNDHLLIDRWRDQPLRSYTGTIYVAGATDITMEYYENGGVATARLSWFPVDDIIPTPAPEPQANTVIVDDLDPGFVRGGSVHGWRTASEGYSGRILWTRNNDRVRSYYNWARWYPRLLPGRYEVFVYIPERYTTTSNARYWVSHRDGYTLRVVDQSNNGDRWVSLGTYRFGGSSQEYVSLADITYESYLTQLIAFDAVKWVSR
jgi:hypothetical protein